MKTVAFLIAFIAGMHLRLSAQDTITTRVIVYDRIIVKGEGTYQGRITRDDRKDSITIVTDQGPSTFSYDEIDKIEYNIARARRESQMYSTVTQDGDRPHMSSYARAPRLYTKEQINHIRTVSIVLSAVGAGLHAGGFGLMFGGDPNSSSGADRAVGGLLIVTAGSGLSLGSMATWIVYAHKLHKYKKQQEIRKF